MNPEKIKILRDKISIPLNTAVQLLKKHNGDILICEQEFHSDNIKMICKIAECNEETAKENYLKFKYDIAKAIEKINQRQVIITTRENKIPKNEIGFIIWPENANGESYKTVKRNDMFIPSSDFDYILEEFKSVFPLKNPLSKTIEDSFDICGHNYFDNEICKQIVGNISRIKNDDPNIEQFLQEVINWFNDKLKYADNIIVYGNL